MAFNYNRFTDHRVRQALAFAMDKPAIVENSGLAENLVQPHPYDSALYAAPERHEKVFGEGFVDELTQYDQDTDRAAGLLEEAGWQKDDGQWYDENDEKVQITVRVPPTWTEWVNMVQTVVQDLNDFGIDAEFETQELVVYYGQTMIQVDYDMAAWWCGGARPYPWFAYNTAWNALQTIADDNYDPDEYEDVPFPIGDPNGDTEAVNWQEKLDQLAKSRVDSEEHTQLSRELGWTYNQMLPVYCMNENKGLAVLNRNKWYSPGEGSEPAKVFFPLTYMHSQGQIKSLGK